MWPERIKENQQKKKQKKKDNHEYFVVTITKSKKTTDNFDQLLTLPGHWSTLRCIGGGHGT